MNEPAVSIVGMAGTPVVSKLIRHLDKVEGVKEPVNHVAWKFYWGPLVLLYESHLKGGVQITPWLHVEEAQASGRIYRIVEYRMPATAFQVQLLWRECEKRDKLGYDRLRILGYYAWIRGSRRTNEDFLKIHRENAMTCNELLVDTGRLIFECMQDLDFSNTPNKVMKFCQETIPEARVT